MSNKVKAIYSWIKETIRGRHLLAITSTSLTLLLLVGFLLPLFLADPRDTNPENSYLSPALGNLFGTDKFGRDVFSRCISAIRLDLLVGISISALAMVIGTAIGLISGYRGGLIDRLVMQFTDVLLAFPGFLLSLIVVAVLGNSVFFVMLAVTLSFIPYFIRLTRSGVLVQRQLSYVQAARMSGNSSWRVAFVHILPNVVGPSIIQATLVASWAILSVASLAFLGVGIRPPTAEWGVMVAEGASDIIIGKWWTSIFPGAMVVLAALGFHIIGDELQASQ